MLKQRLIYGAAMILAMIGVFYLDHQLDRVDLTGTFWRRVFLGRDYLPAGLLILGLFVVLIALTAREICAIARAKDIHADPVIVTLSGVTGCVLTYIIPFSVGSQTTVALIASLMILIFFLALLQYSWLHQRPQGALAVGGVTMMAFVYMGMMPGFYLAIRRSYSVWVLAGIILITKCCDIGAYFTGRAIGRHKLIPWLSPGKTWEGLVGGVTLSALASAALALIANERGLSVWLKDDLGRRIAQPVHLPIVGAFLGGALMGAVGQFGDLTASLFKRDAGIKDSGDTIPGFGGLLDVLDSPVVVAPLAYWLLWLAKQNPW